MKRKPIKKYVAYYRVSTSKQQISGLGLLAQEEAVNQYVINEGGEIIEEFTEIESGSHNNRPEVAKAIAASAKLYARKHKLGKEAVDYAHSIETQAEIKLGEILLLMDKNEGAKGIGKSVIRNDDSTLPPTLTELGISLNLSSEAQALAAKRKREPDHKFGAPNPVISDEIRQGVAQRKATAAREDPKVRHAFHYITTLREQGRTFAEIAQLLNAEKYTTRTGKEFHPGQVWRIYKRLNTTKARVKAKKV